MIVYFYYNEIYYICESLAANMYQYIERSQLTVLTIAKKLIRYYTTAIHYQHKGGNYGICRDAGML